MDALDAIGSCSNSVSIVFVHAFVVVVRGWFLLCFVLIHFRFLIVMRVISLSLFFVSVCLFHLCVGAYLDCLCVCLYIYLRCVLCAVCCVCRVFLIPCPRLIFLVQNKFEMMRMHYYDMHNRYNTKHNQDTTAEATIYIYIYMFKTPNKHTNTHTDADCAILQATPQTL